MHLRIRAPLTQQALVSLRIATRYLACRGRRSKRVIGDVDTARSPCCRQCCAAQQFTPFHIPVSCPPEKIQFAGSLAYTAEKGRQRFRESEERRVGKEWGEKWRN